MSKKIKSSSRQITSLAGKGEVRIIGGTLRGRKIHFPDGDGLRPTLDRIRETLFNWLARDIAGSCCLDLFSGSGALGFEAASRGAKQVVLVEKNSLASQALQANISRFGLTSIALVNQSAESFLAATTTLFDLVFLDPPFGQGLLPATLDLLMPHLTPDAIVYIEQEFSQTPFVPGADWTQLKSKKTSRFIYELYQRGKLE